MEWRPLGTRAAAIAHSPGHAAGAPIAGPYAMSRIILCLTFAGVFHFFWPVTVLAQSENGDSAASPSKWGEIPTAAPVGAVTRQSTEDSYDFRALRLEAHWGTMRILRGADGPVLGTAGVFRTVNVEKLLAGSARAQSEARLFRASHRSGSVATAVGLLTFGAGIIVSTNNANNAATPVLMIGGLGSVLWGARQLNKSYSSLSRAVWWYNRDLKTRD